MSKIQALRLYELLESKRYGISQPYIQEELGISSATFKRALKQLREQNVTVFPPANQGYRLDDKSRGLTNLGGELLNQKQIGILLESYQRLSALIQADIHKDALAPVLKRLTKLLDQPKHKRASLDAIHQQSRLDTSNNFKPLLRAVDEQRCIKTHYQARSSGASERMLSPQRLLYYRENWYLIAWCHSKHAMRTFAVEKFTHIEASDDAFHSVPEPQLKAFYADTYGIFGGEKTGTASIQFSANVAKWVRDELWHSQQVLEAQQDGGVIMHLPIGDNLTELVRDLMRYGADIRIFQPEELRKALLVQHVRAVDHLGSPNEPTTE